MTEDFQVQRFARDFARRLAKLERSQRKTGVADLRHAALDNGAGIPVKDEDGNTTAYVGSGPSGIEHVDGPMPVQPSVPFVDAGGEVVKVQHSGLDHEDNPGPADWRRTIVHASLEETFEPSFATRAGYIDDMDGSFSHRLPGGEWWIAVQWETLSGKVSPLSEPVLADVAPLVDTGDIEDALETAQERIDQARDEAEPRFEALETGLATNESNISDAVDRITTAEQTLSPLPGRIESAEQDVATAQEEATKASAAAVEANNRAMTRLANGNFESDLLYWDHDSVSLTSTAHSGQQAAQIDGWLRPASSFPVVADQIWELSLYYQHDVTVEFQAVDGDQRTTLSTHHLDGDSSWSDSGTLRVTIPADVHMLSFTITGTTAIVDGITLRDVTDVVRLEEAANANRQKAEQAISELAVMRLAVDGEGGLKDRLTSAETVLETKADESALDQLDQKLAGDLAAFEAHYTRIWRQPTPPPPGTHYAWLGEPHASPSVRLDSDGNETARNLATNPHFDGNFAPGYAAPYGALSIADSILIYEATREHGFAERLDLNIRIDDPGEYTITYYAEVPESVTEVRWQQFIGVEFESKYTDRVDGWAEYSTTFTVIEPGNKTIRFYLPGIPTGDTARFDWVFITQSDVPYFDGDTESDRANDLWYNSDGVPHEWENGQGWVELSDARITELANTVSAHATRLQTAETGLEEALEGPIDHDRLRVGTGAFDEAFASKLIADHATIINAAMRNLSVEEKLLFAEAIGEQIWAKLGVFDRLDAREAYVGGAHIKEGAITADKITATRELITKIMGAEWAYIAEQLVVDGELIANNASIINAAMQSLSVTERLDFVEAFGDEIYSKESITEVLTAGEAWIAGTLLKDNTVDTKNLNVTEEMVAAFARILHLVVDEMDVNSLWADQSWQRAGHFGSEEADQSTRVDGTGLRITKHDHDNETSTDIVRLGGEGIGLVFSDDQGNITGSQSPEGDASYRDVSVDRLTIGGRLLLPETDPAEFWDGNLWDSQPKGLVCFHEENMAGVSVNHLEYGFIEVSHHVRANRMYRVTTNNFLMDNSQAHYGRFRYTIGDNPDAPHTESPQLGNTWLINTSTTGNVQVRGDHTFVPEQDGLMRILLCVSRIGTTTGISFNSASSFATAQLRLEDLGPTRPYTGMPRNAGHGGAGTVRDPRPLVGGITTAWDMTWFQNYSHGGTQRRSSSTNPSGYGASGLTQGQRQDSAHTEGLWSSLFGFTTATESTNPADVGVSLAAALNGAEILSMHLEVTSSFAWQSNGNTRYVFWHHNHTTAPSQYNAAPDSIGDYLLRLGNRARIPLNIDQLGNLAKTGALTGFGIANATSTAHLYAGQLSWANRPKLVVNYQR